MKDSIELLLNKCDSTYLAELWLFYRNYFACDEEYFKFLQSVFTNEPNKNEVWTSKRGINDIPLSLVKW